MRSENPAPTEYERFFHTSGTLRYDAPSYIEREADDRLFNALSRGEFCYVLTSRQMGKSSLMVRTAHRLRQQGVSVVVLDLTALGQLLTSEQWYAGLLTFVGQDVALEEEMEALWRSNSHLGPLHRWLMALKRVVLARCPGRTVIFIDEIDAVRSLPFNTDEFFAGIRECYNRRAVDREFERLTFCLLGTAAPSELTDDPRRTPFNIGQCIELTDFSEEEAASLAQGLNCPEPLKSTLLQRVLFWTAGHPYLTQRLYQALALNQSVCEPAEVDGCCERLFLSSSGREQDDNLVFVRERLLRDEADRTELLALYARIWSGGNVAPDKTNRFVGLLRLAGIVRVAGRSLVVRNRIYARVFDRDWMVTHAHSRSLFTHNLPVQRTSFVGREKERVEVKELTETAPLVTLTGAGGCGKTRLALEVAADLLDRFPEGAWLVDLAPVMDPALVPQTVAAALGVEIERDRPVLATLSEYLRCRRLLLILDNCEHLLFACAELADALLRHTSEFRILATSRQPLGLNGERVLHVASLSFPDPQRSCLPSGQPTELLQYEAVRLFVDRASLKQPGFAVTPENSLEVTQICQRLDGMPLALELAAARLTSLSVEQIMQRLDDRFRLLTGGHRTALPRQQTLKATLDWSYTLLDRKERVLLRRVSVFTGGWTLEAAEAVCAGNEVEQREVLDLLVSLRQKSLVLHEETKQAGRFRVLETVRQYGWNKLQETGEAEAVRRRHGNWCVEWAERAAPELCGPGQPEWLDRLEEEHGNLRAAFDWFVQTRQVEPALRLFLSLHRFWGIRNYGTEARDRMNDLLALGGVPAHNEDWARALEVIGWLSLEQGDREAAHQHFAQSLAIGRALNDRGRIAAALSGLGVVAAGNGSAHAARALFEESLAIRRELPDEGALAGSLALLGDLLVDQGDFTTARAILDEGLGISRRMGDKASVGWSLFCLGKLSSMQGDTEGARELFEEGLAVFCELQHPRGAGNCLLWLGHEARASGDYEMARSRYEESKTCFEALGDQRTIALIADRLAELPT